ncbi:hypothetical protein [Sphingobacterium sp. UBA1498]|uniref:hypothetical protein n=1 Tax=Sphingobacterium sp. UBA1498 TaxID=1947481 RepID=UPI0025DA8C93|nr:hypothetical protein [Sphingobacterium sp. UBA1498]
MFTEIKNKYENFSDSLISEIKYSQIHSIRTIEIILKCMNRFSNYDYETIKLIFDDVIFFHFKEEERYSSTVINSAFLNNDKGIIVFDFFPLLYADKLEENPDSDLIVKSRLLSYIKIEDEQ